MTKEQVSMLSKEHMFVSHYIAQVNALISCSGCNPAQMTQLKETGSKDNENTIRKEESFLLT